MNEYLICKEPQMLFFKHQNIKILNVLSLCVLEYYGIEIPSRYIISSTNRHQPGIVNPPMTSVDNLHHTQMIQCLQKSSGIDPVRCYCS